MFTEFKNEPRADFTKEENIRQMETALRLLDAQKGVEFPIVIGGKRYTTEKKIVSVNPSNGTEIVCKASAATVELADQAVQCAYEAFQTWRHTAFRERAAYLMKAAAILRRRRLEFAVWLIEEAGKNMTDAAGEVCGLIDYLEYYAREAVRLAAGVKVASIPAELNECFYVPLGVGIIIAPWNFPLSIMAGMAVAGIVTGNTVVIKPASATVGIAAKFCELMEEVGLPPGVVNYLPGSGGEVGDYLVSHRLTRFVNFTGSKEVGLRINELAAKTAPGQIWIKRTALEMGGKDAIIVDEDANLEDAAAAITFCAFAFQGQKCSACSRAIIVESVYDRMVELIAKQADALTVGPSRQAGLDMGPVIDERAYEKIRKYIEIGQKEGRIVTKKRTLPANGYFIAPTVIADLSRTSTIAREEIFGPVLAVIKAKDFADAMHIANGTEYGLTGAVFTNKREKLALARRDFYVGNLGLNTRCTGATVGVQPFGGFNMSGTDSKCGGPEYLQLFLQAKTVTEKL